MQKKAGPLIDGECAWQRHKGLIERMFLFAVFDRF